jgi:hypothetical protein
MLLIKPKSSVHYDMQLRDEKINHIKFVGESFWNYTGKIDKEIGR